MAPKTRKRVLRAAGMVVALAALLLHYKQRDTYRCQGCFAAKDVFQWRLGWSFGLSVPLTPGWEGIGETRFLHDFLASDHIHDWIFAQGSPYYYFGTTSSGCALGKGRFVGFLGRMYASDPEFSAFIQAKLQDGSLARADVIALLSCPRTGESSSIEKSPIEKDAQALSEAFLTR